MTRNFGISAEDRRSSAIAKALIKALSSIESSPDDPEGILDAASLMAVQSGVPVGVSGAVIALRRHYLKET